MNNVSTFVHLRTKSDHSLLDGACTIPQLVQRARDLDMQAVGLIDNDTLSAIPEFLAQCRKQGIHPIVGANYRTQASDEKYYWLSFICLDETGYENLVRLNNIAQANKKHHPYLTLDDLINHNEGLVCLTYKYLSDPVKEENIDQAVINAQSLQNIFADRLYIELQSHDTESQKIAHQLHDISVGLKIASVTSSDVRYLTPDDAEHYDVFLSAGQHPIKLKHGNRFSVLGSEHHLRTTAEMIETYADFPLALARTAIIASSCTFTAIPTFDYKINEIDDAPLKLRQACVISLVDRLGELTAPYLERLDHELEIFAERNESGYLLMLKDIVDFAKANDIPMGPGRGSAAGSLVAYTLGITQLDPIEYELLFERLVGTGAFALDIDIDVSARKRQELQAYLHEKYGALQVQTFGKFKAKSAITVAARALGFDIAFGKHIASKVPAKPVFIAIYQALDSSDELRQLHETNEDARKIIEAAKWLEGKIYTSGVNAAGLELSGLQQDMLPLKKLAADGPMVCQYTTRDLELLKVRKQDILGLSTLDHMHITLAKLKEQGVDIDPYKLSTDDAKTYDLLSLGLTSGVFMMGNTGIQAALKTIRPTRLQDLIALVALYRPGPMDHIPTYAKRKWGEETVVWKHEKIKAILEETHGIVIYQEQLMQMAKEIAGFTPQESDNLRKIIGKKWMDKMLEQKEKFIQGCAVHTPDLTHEEAKNLWEADFLPSADYSFNKSHAASYAFLTYITAYLKANHPKEYLETILESTYSPEQRKIYEDELSRLTVTYSILP